VCSLFQIDGGYQFHGVAVLEADRRPVQAQYKVECSAGWETQFVVMSVWRGDREEGFTLTVDPPQHWRQNGLELESFQGLVDVDLGFTPATNTLAIRRLNLAVGNSGTTTTVWVDFPTLEIVRFPQRYTRLGEDEYLFESLEDSFKARLKVDEFGLVTDYEGLWVQVSRAG